MNLEIGTKEWRREQGQRQQLLNHCLEDLCNREISSLDDQSAIARGLNAVYSGGQFRHQYAGVLSVIRDSKFADTLSGEKRAQYVSARAAGLAQNIKNLYTHKCDERCKQIAGGCPVVTLQKSPQLWKLYDHVNLEARRAAYEETVVNETADRLKESLSALNSVKGELEKAKTATDKAREKAERLQHEIVSILGVFSAIVLAFNASVTFTTSSIAATDTTPPFNVAFIVSIVGLVLFNCLYGAFALIYRIIRPEKSPDSLLPPKRVAGLELCAVSCALFLGTLTYFHGLDISCYEVVSLVIAIFVLLYGISLTMHSECKQGEPQDSPQ